MTGLRGPTERSDPSDRFSEHLSCGCDYYAGVWFLCATHFALAEAKRLLTLDNSRLRSDTS